MQGWSIKFWDISPRIKEKKLGRKRLFQATMKGVEMAEVFAVIMAGGRGERLWPLSTAVRPKQFLPFFRGKVSFRPQRSA